MRNNETGEYELVVGNKQLLSGFFIVVLLCAVAFAMGYVVGENSHVKPAEMATAASPKGEPRPDAASPAPPASSAPRSESTEPPAADATPQPTTRPARDVEPETPKRRTPEPKAAPPEPKPQPKEVPQPKNVLEGAPGQFWQVTATTNRDSAQNLLQSLREKGFPATLSPGPNNFTRVLVGPYTDYASMGKAKTELESAGFSKLVRK